MIEFKHWPKIIRIENKRKPIFTEKIDGTNACIAIHPLSPENEDHNAITTVGDGIINPKLGIWAQSRNHFLSPNNDNYGFAKWVEDNKEDLITLGPGHHYGEWWGRGIGRNYGQTERFFSLFNIFKWGSHNSNTPKCCNIVPIIRANTIEDVVAELRFFGSKAVPGWMKPEGAVMYEPDAGPYFKIIMDK